MFQGCLLVPEAKRKKETLRRQQNITPHIDKGNKSASTALQLYQTVQLISTASTAYFNRG
jgi:hypothetical protein